MADTILTQTVVILFFMGIGLASGRFGCLKEEAQKWLASFVMTLSLPAAILLSAEGPLTPERSTGVFWMLALSAGSFAITYPLAMLLARRAGPGTHRGLFAASLVFANVGLLGFPLSEALVPGNGLFYAAFFNLVSNSVFFTFGMRMFRPDGRMGSLRTVLTNPNLVATFTMLVLFVMNWHLPELIRHPISLLGSLCSPLSLVLVGAKLAAVRPRELFAGRALKAAALIRLVGIPLATIAVLCVLRPPREVAMVLVIMNAMPVAANTVAAAQQAGLSSDFCAKSAALTNLLFPITLPAILLLAQAVFTW